MYNRKYKVDIFKLINKYALNYVNWLGDICR